MGWNAILLTGAWLRCMAASQQVPAPSWIAHCFESRAFRLPTADLVHALSDPQASLTFFAPTSSAILTTIKRTSTLKFDVANLRAALLNHLVAGKLDSASFPAQLVSGDGCALKAVGEEGGEALHIAPRVPDACARLLRCRPSSTPSTGGVCLSS